MVSTSNEIEGAPIAAEVVGERSWRRWVWLIYLAMYPLPWFVRPPSTIAVMVSGVGLVVFLFLYVRATTNRRNDVIVCSIATLLLSFALQPFGGLWSVFAIYAAAFVANLRPPRAAAGMIAAFGVAVILFSLARGLAWFEWIWPVFFGGMVGVSSILFASLQEKNRLLAQSRESARQLAVVAERERIARDLHDLLGHTLTVVAVKADLAAKLVERDSVRAAAEIEDIRSTARSALADIRAAVTGMRSTTLSGELAQARQTLAAAGVAFEFTGLNEPLPAVIESTFAYLIREAVTNVVRHAHANRCSVRITRDAKEVQLEVQDDGSGIRAGEGNGIAGMRARVAQFSGRLELRTQNGTRISVSMPISAPEAA